MKKTPIDQLLEKVEYIPTNTEPNEDGLPYATHEGVLSIGEISIRVYRLNTGETIIEKEDLDNMFGFPINNL